MAEAETDENIEPATADLLVKKKPSRASCVVEVDEDTKVKVTFEGIGRDRFEEMLDAHTPDNEDGTKEGQSENTATFAPALIAASAIEPPLTEEQVHEMWHGDTWNRTELNVLYSAALAANTKSAVKRMGEG